MLGTWFSSLAESKNQEDKTCPFPLVEKTSVQQQGKLALCPEAQATFEILFLISSLCSCDLGTMRHSVL